ncbi:fumarate reductase/succinate dehydrogenase flavoprotein subunit [Kibdelosporangium philippinense]|uniref:Fumarate reductase/succinate dehydrogenase flavoprotein subunit n=1 Tax=Kibdelosporangium philippinense TaxID=211113 RepID=A0ABS8ZEK7_9PSEU|nr:fumarate reductase/succinate dehydrogenase flavoprotein subunit [Kibdelosporangium philippinense]MCE7006255.1 fumarate reductase/succinate dehydrogenase flavoprotein subunit [Kibdelosporangium philippinense]
MKCDVLVIGGGTAGTMAAITAAEHGASVILLEKAHVRHSGALAMGMDGVNNAVIPGKATPEDYVAEITKANDGVVNQKTIYQTATRGYDMVRRLERYGVKFEKDDYGEYNVRRVHRSGSYVLPMPEGKDVKKVLYRVLRRREMREKIQIENRVMPVRVLTHEGRAVGAVGFNTRTGDLVTVSAGAVILATGACGRLGLPASGYLYGTYENPTNAGDGYSMAYHAGAELSGIECFQINPLIKDYNGPACAYVANPFGGYQVNSEGNRFVDCDYWSGQMMSEFSREIARGPVYLKLSHLPDETVTKLENILHTTERPTRGTFHSGRGHDYRTHDVEMHISEIGLCGGHSASGVWVDENGATTVPGLYAAGDLACVPHNYMIGAFVFGDLAGAHASTHLGAHVPLPEDQIAATKELIYRPLANPDGPPQPQVEYKLRRFVNDYLSPPKSSTRLEIGLESFERMTAEIAAMGARTPHELMRCAEVTFIRDCAEMAARSSLVRTESRWGLYHERLDHPVRDDSSWLYHLNLVKTENGMEFRKRPVDEYIVPVPEFRAQHDAEIVELGTFETSRRALVTAGPAQEQRASRSPRVLEILELAEQELTLADLAPYLSDVDADVRRTAIATLTEVTPDGFGLALAEALEDPHSTVRVAAANGLLELVEVITPSPDLRAALLRGVDPEVRATALEVLRALRLGDRTDFEAALTDERSAVRVAAIHGLVSLDANDLIAKAGKDSSREVRVAVATGLGAIGNLAAAAVLGELATDLDALVRAAAFEAAAQLRATAPLDGLAVTAITDHAWQVRKGAAQALGAAEWEVAEGPLLQALKDSHADVRKAAVQALERWASFVSSELRAVSDDEDADVRAYARRALG